MNVLVGYATKYGATQGIAERIAEQLQVAGVAAEVRPVQAVGDLTGYDAYVIGSAIYMGAWRKEATAFVQSNQAILAAHPVWLFGSGPLGAATTDSRGQDLLVVSEPKEFAEFTEAIRPRGRQMFFGALDPRTLTLPERLLRRLPAGRTLLPEGDFRDWSAIDAWAAGIAHELATVSTLGGQEGDPTVEVRAAG
jgi:menaquinone-dependent protoporphyrinogen oxidase